MAFDEKLGARIRDLLAGHPDVAERKMFGGLCFLVRGRMCCGIVGSDLMVRVGPDDHERALARPHARPMDFTGRPMKGMVYVSPAGLRTASALGAWVERGIRCALAMPPKTRRTRVPRRRGARTTPAAARPKRSTER